MQEIGGGLFGQSCDAICIPTNGAVGQDGLAIMGAGVAREAALKFQGLRRVLGSMIQKQGHSVHIVTCLNGPMAPGIDRKLPYHVISFPTKPSKVYKAQPNTIMPEYQNRSASILPGWMGLSNLDIIRHSAEELLEAVEREHWHRVCLPRVGCGHGGLRWEDVRAVLEKCLDDRFVVVTP